MKKETNNFIKAANESLNPKIGTPESRRNASIAFARSNGVSEDRIIKDSSDLLAFFEGK